MFRSQIDNDTLLWIDQISIDQRDDAERGHQVRMMSDIYVQARNVIVWLGRSRGVNTRILQTLERHGDFLSELHPSISDEEGLCIAKCDSQTDQCALCSCLDADGGRPKLKAYGSTDLKDINELTYWDRLWIVQENVLAKNSVFFLGEHRYHRLDILQYAQIWSRVFGFAPYGLESLKHIVALTSTSGFQGQMNLDQVLVRYFHQRKKCTDPHDLVYGLLGLVKPSQRVSVDYQSSLTEMFTRMLDVLLRSSTLQESHAFYAGGWPNTLSDLIVFLRFKLVKWDTVAKHQPAWSYPFLRMGTYEMNDFLKCLNCLERLGLRKARWIVEQLTSIVHTAREIEHTILPSKDWFENQKAQRQRYELEVLVKFVRSVNAASDLNLPECQKSIEEWAETSRNWVHYPATRTPLDLEYSLIVDQAEA